MTLLALGVLPGFSGASARAEALVSNIDLIDSADLSLSGKVRVQEFTTGEAGASLGSVEIKFSTGSARLDAPAATLRRWDGSSHVLVAELAGPGKLAAGDNRFYAPESTALDANTVYAVRLEGGGSGVAPRGTTDNGESGRSRWSIRDESHHRETAASSYETSATALMIRANEAGVRGTFDPFEPPLAPNLTLSETTSDDGAWTVSWSGAELGDFYTYVELEETPPGGTASISTHYVAPGSASISGKTATGAYGYRVRGCRNICSDWSGKLTVTFDPPLGTPTITAPSSNTTGSYDVSWTSVTGATSYVLEEKVGTGTWSKAQDSSSRTKSYSGKGLGSYHYRVKACEGSDDCGNWSTTKTVTVELGTPSITSPSSGSNTSGAYTMGWTSVANATSYTLEEKVGTGSWTKAQDSASRTKAYSGKGLGTYKYRVKACAGSACGDWSPTKTVTVELGTPSITSPSSGSNTSGAYTVGWTSVTNATSYVLEQKVGTGSWTEAQDSASRTKAYSGKGLATYHYRVKACAGSACGDWSTAKTLTVELGTPSITSPSGGSNTSGAYTVGWTSVANATSYVLEEKVGTGSWTEAQDSSSRTKRYSGKGLGAYHYRVKACAGSACGDWSTTKTVTVELGTPSITSPSSGSNTSGTYTVGWTSVTNAATYRLEEKIGTGSWNQVQNASSRSVNYAGKGLGTYYYRVKACAGSACGDWSPTKTVTVGAGGAEHHVAVGRQQHERELHRGLDERDATRPRTRWRRRSGLRAPGPRHRIRRRAPRRTPARASEPTSTGSRRAPGAPAATGRRRRA